MTALEATVKAPHIPLKRVTRAWYSRPNYLLFAADVSMLLLLPLAFLVSLDLWPQTEAGLLRHAPVPLVALSAFLAFGFANSFYDWHYFNEQLTRPLRAFGAVIFTFGVLLLIGFAFKITDNYSRLWLGLWFASLTLYVLLSRVVLAWYLARQPYERLNHRRAIILGAGENGHQVLRHIRSFSGHGIEVVGFVDDRGSRLPENQTGTPILGSTAQLKPLVCDQGVDLVIIAMPWSAFDRIRELLHKISEWAVDIYMAPDQLGLLYADRPVYRIGGMHVLSLKDKPISEWSALIKRLEDLAIAIPAVILLSPVLALTALAIRLESKGSPIFVQKRYGFNNNLIDVYKFRSMYVDQSDANAAQQTTRHDKRVTRVGRLIRRTSIDELPQLFNVIEGTMSIVGPRPHAIHTKAGDQLFQEAVDVYASRHRVKPGITGWAQCNGWRGETDTKEKLVKRVEYDLYYIDNWSIFFDLLIIFRTLWALVRPDQKAY